LPALIEVDQDSVQEEFFERGWTDGLPVIPPTPPLVEAMLATVDLEGDDVIGSIPRRSRSVTAEQAATNAVMAGCRPEYFPIVVAALGALLDPAFNAHAALSSTGGAASCVLVSGPLAAEVGMNSTHNALGSGNRANATIGRAVRLVARNVLGASTGKLDATAMGNPGKYTLCFAENEPPAPWQPLRVQLGYEPQDTVVTVMATEAPRQVANHLSEVPEDVLRTFVSAIKVAANYSVGKGGQGIVVMGPEHAQAVRQAGWTQPQARDFLCRESRITPEELRACGVPLEVGNQHDMVAGEDGKLPSIATPEDVYLVTCGGAGPGWSAYIPSFAPLQHTRAVSRRVRPLGEAMPDCGPDSCEVDLSTFSRPTGQPR
jgi:hypothetical protein